MCSALPPIKIKSKCTMHTKSLSYPHDINYKMTFYLKVLPFLIEDVIHTHDRPIVTLTAPPSSSSTLRVNVPGPS
jgi:hypothetical protein